jgi:hypothetical protein
MLLILYLAGPRTRQPGIEKGKPWTGQATQKESQVSRTLNKETNTTAITRPQP